MFLLQTSGILFNVYSTMRNPALRLSCLCLLAIYGCSRPPAPPSRLTANIIATRPHDPDAYTQGLQLKDGILYECAGMYGVSNVRATDPISGNILRQTNLPANVFGEGLTYHDGKIFALTWREQTVFILDPETLTIERTASYDGEGWGLTSDGTHLIMSDGTSTLRFIDPATFTVVRKLSVTENRQPVINLNELEFVDGQIYANVYLTDRIVRINPHHGHVTAAIDLSSLRSRLPSSNRAEAMNGIAFDKNSGNFLITGKYWPLIFELNMTPE